MNDEKQAGQNLQFLKLGGSLITDKSRPATARPEVLARLAEEIASAFRQEPDLRLVFGHGSGSFGHVPAKKYGTRQGVRTAEQWAGFAQVWHQAASLNHLVLEALHSAELPALAFPASASVIAQDGRVHSWDLAPLREASQMRLLPVVYGDVVFDKTRGGTILSTEDIFNHLARELKPRRILLAGLEAGVWGDYPDCTQLVEEITPDNLKTAAPSLSGSANTDVTGGMASKVKEMLALCEEIPGLEVLIFSGEPAGMVRETLLGAHAGTRLRTNPK